MLDASELSVKKWALSMDIFELVVVVGMVVEEEELVDFLLLLFCSSSLTVNRRTFDCNAVSISLTSLDKAERRHRLTAKASSARHSWHVPTLRPKSCAITEEQTSYHFCICCGVAVFNDNGS